MKIVIDIPENDFNFFKDLHDLIIGGRGTCKTVQYNLINAIRNGVPLPKGHGRLIDADALKTSRTMALVAEKSALRNEIAFAPLVCVLKENIDDAPTIIEADKETEE